MDSKVQCKSSTIDGLTLRVFQVEMPITGEKVLEHTLCRFWEFPRYRLALSKR